MPNYNYNQFIGRKAKDVKRSLKDLSHEWKHDINVGDLVPCLMIPTLPSDDFKIRSQFFFKFEPLYFPLIHRLSLDVDYFWVRNGSMWPTEYDGSPSDSGWENWIMLKNNSEAHPTVDWKSEYETVGALNNSVMGYFGLPYTPTQGGDREPEIQGLNAFPPMAYLMIYDQYYRHPQLEEPVARFRLTGGDNTNIMNQMYGTLQQDIRANVTNRYDVAAAKWGKDYLTSCLPTPQVGDPVLIPSLQLDADGNYIPQNVYNIDGTAAADGTLTIESGQLGTSAAATPVVIETNGSIRELSLMSVLQTLKEQLMKGYQRYKDWIDWSHNEDVDPLSLNIPIMIGSYRGSVQISDVLTQANTTVGEDDFFSGTYSGNAGLYETGMQTINYHCRDYGILMAIMSLTPNTGYGQGINRYWRYNDPLDYPMDIFATVGDQEVLKEEAVYNNVTLELDKNQETFGYIPRFAEASFINNNYGTNLLFNAGLSVHAGKNYEPLEARGTNYDNNVVISKKFLAANWDADGGGGTRVSDIFRVLTFTNGNASQKPCYAYVYHEIQAMRPLPAYSVPTLGG